MFCGPRTRFSNPVAQPTNAGSFAAIAVEPGWPAAGANGPAAAVLEQTTPKSITIARTFIAEVLRENESNKKWQSRRRPAAILNCNARN
jgi:hypothetical protein